MTDPKVANAAIDIDTLDDLKSLLGKSYNRLIEQFIFDGQKRIQLLREAIDSHNFEVIFFEAHGFKGSSRNIGAFKMGDVCEQLENRGQRKQFENMETLFATLEQDFAAVCSELIHSAKTS